MNNYSFVPESCRIKKKKESKELTPTKMRGLGATSLTCAEQQYWSTDIHCNSDQSCFMKSKRKKNKNKLKTSKNAIVIKLRPQNKWLISQEQPYSGQMLPHLVFYCHIKKEKNTI